MNQRNQTQQILAHLSGQVGPLPAREVAAANKEIQSPDTRGPRFLVVFAGNPIGLEGAVQQLISWRQKGCAYDVAFSANAEALMQPEAIVRSLKPVQVIHRSMKELEHYALGHLSGVLVPQITHNTARKLVQGIQDGLVPNLLWQALWDGIPVYMNLESLTTYHGRTTQNQALNRMMKTTINALQEMGIREWNQFKGIQGEVETSRRQMMADTISEKRREMVQVITEKDVLAHAAHKNLMIGATAIVTPLARDTAAARGIAFVRKT